MKSKIEKIITGYVNKVWKDNDDNLGFRVRDDNKIEEIERLEFTKKELLKYSTLLIDHLNSQDQEEENNFVYTVGTPILESTTTCSQDTPEELIKRKLKEITTSERVGFLYAVGDDDLLANELYDYIQQLLGERETFTKGELNNLLDWIENGYVPSIEVRDEIDKGIIKK